MSVDTFTTIPATIGGGFIGGLLLGYALKKVVKLIAVVVGLFIAGLVYLQHQQLAYFHWEKIKTTVTEIFGNVSSQILDQYYIVCIIKLRDSINKWHVRRLCSWVYEGVTKLDKDNVLTRNIRTIQSSSNQGIM
jgi:uncharacterized membrane protein (Fun14 family)